MKDDSRWTAEQAHIIWNSQPFSVSTEPGLALSKYLIRARDAMETLIVDLLVRAATVKNTPVKLCPRLEVIGLQRELLWSGRPYTLRVNLSRIMGMEVILNARGAIESQTDYESKLAKGPLRTLSINLAEEFGLLKSMITDAFDQLVVLGDEWLGRCFREWEGVFAPKLIDNLYQRVRDLFTGDAAAASLEIFVFLWHNKTGGVYVLDKQSIEHALRRCSGSPFPCEEGGYGVAHTMAVTRVLPNRLFPLDRQPRRCALSDAPYLASGLNLLEMTLFRDRHAAGQTIATGGGFTAEAWYPWDLVAKIGPILAAPNRIGDYLADESQRMGEQFLEWLSTRGSQNDLSDNSAAIQATSDLLSRRRYPVAISCAGGSHVWFQHLIDEISKQLGRDAVFYYRNENSPESRIRANGSRGLDLLRQIYRQSELVVVFLEHSYQGDACSIESREIFRRLDEQVPNGVLLYRFDDSRHLGFTSLDIVQRIDGSPESAKDVANEITVKLQHLRRA